MISSYTFGNIIIDGRSYTSDLMIFPDGRILENWRRQSGHALAVGDLAPLLKEQPGLIIVGTGAQGRMIPARDLTPCLAEKDIEIHILDTDRAAALYNKRLTRGQSPAACFHLTC